MTDYCQCEYPMIKCDHRGCRCTICGNIENSLIFKNNDRFKYLTDEPRAVIPPDAKMELTYKTTYEMIYEREQWIKATVTCAHCEGKGRIDSNRDWKKRHDKFLEILNKMDPPLSHSQRNYLWCMISTDLTFPTPKDDDDGGSQGG